MRKTSRTTPVEGAGAVMPAAAEQPAQVQSPGPVPAAASLEAALAELDWLSLDELRVRWRNQWGRLAPAHLSRNLLARIMDYRLQAEAFGDLDRKTARTLERLAGAAVERSPAHGSSSLDAALSTEVAQSEIADPLRHAVAAESQSGSRRPSEPLILKPGTMLTREWRGRIESVMVVQNGFAWNGDVFSSLTAVALAMTGTKWSGSRFFGVRPQDRAPLGSETRDAVGDRSETLDADLARDRRGRGAKGMSDPLASPTRPAPPTEASSPPLAATGLAGGARP